MEKTNSDAINGQSLSYSSTMHMMKRTGFGKRFYESRFLLVLILPCFLYYLLFHYFPLWGILVSFKDFSPFLGFADSPWVGLKHFQLLFSFPSFPKLVKNTFVLSLLSVLWGFPAPIMLALVVNEVRNMKIKKFVQTVSYLPHFISTVVVVGMVTLLLSPRGALTNILTSFGVESANFLSEAKYFRTIYIASDIWQSAGWGSIIYLAALTAIDTGLYEAAVIDGANKFKQLIYITLPGIAPTIITMLILRIGTLMSVGFEKVYLLQVPSTYSTSDVISTFVYRQGIAQGNFSFATALGIFNSIVNFLFLFTANRLARYSENNLW